MMPIFTRPPCREDIVDPVDRLMYRDVLLDEDREAEVALMDEGEKLVQANKLDEESLLAAWELVLMPKISALFAVADSYFTAITAAVHRNYDLIKTIRSSTTTLEGVDWSMRLWNEASQRNGWGAVKFHRRLRVGAYEAGADGYVVLRLENAVQHSNALSRLLPWEFEPIDPGQPARVTIRITYPEWLAVLNKENRTATLDYSPSRGWVIVSPSGRCTPVLCAGEPEGYACEFIGA